MRIKQILLNIIAYIACLIIGMVLMVCDACKRDKETEDYIDENW